MIRTYTIEVALDRVTGRVTSTFRDKRIVTSHRDSQSYRLCNEEKDGVKVILDLTIRAESTLTDDPLVAAAMDRLEEP